MRIANDTIYGLNASVFTNDVDRARAVAGQLRSGTVGHNAFRTDFGMAFGGFKQSGIGREGGKEGLLPFLETKTVILDGTPQGFGLTARPAALDHAAHLRTRGSRDVAAGLRHRASRRTPRASTASWCRTTSCSARTSTRTAGPRPVASRAATNRPAPTVTGSSRMTTLSVVAA